MSQRYTSVLLLLQIWSLVSKNSYKVWNNISSTQANVKYQIIQDQSLKSLQAIMYKNS